jgi:acetyltransferase (GNAT) family protein
MIFKCLSIDTPRSEFLALDARYRAGFLDAETIRRHARDPECDLDAASVHRSLAAGDECFAIRDGDTLAAYGWYSRAAIYFVSETLRFHFDPRWAYMYRGFTHPAYRGQRLHATGMTMALSALQARGAKGLVSTVERRNDASLKSCYRMGYRDFGTIYEVRVGRLLGIRTPESRWLRTHLIWHTPGCRAFDFRLEALPPRASPRAPGRFPLTPVRWLRSRRVRRSPGVSTGTSSAPAGRWGSSG